MGETRPFTAKLLDADGQETVPETNSSVVRAFYVRDGQQTNILRRPTSS
jgi:hypothetical protein